MADPFAKTVLLRAEGGSRSSRRRWITITAQGTALGRQVNPTRQPEGLREIPPANLGALSVNLFR